MVAILLLNNAIFTFHLFDDYGLLLYVVFFLPFYASFMFFKVLILFSL